MVTFAGVGGLFDAFLVQHLLMRTRARSSILKQYNVSAKASASKV